MLTETLSSHGAANVSDTARIGAATTADYARQKTAMTICVTAWNSDPKTLLRALRNQRGADQATLVIFDNGSDNARLTAIFKKQLALHPGPARLVTSKWRMSRQKVRNALLKHTTSNWLLFLDADVVPDDSEYLSRYIAMAKTRKKPGMFAGGASLLFSERSADTELHAAEKTLHDCLPAEKRCLSPGPNAFSGNILVHRYIVQSIPAEASTGDWGWTDLNWGLMVARRHRVEHVHNPVSTLSLCNDEELIRRYAVSAASYAQTAREHRSLRKRGFFQAARLLSFLPFSGAIAKFGASMARNRDKSVRYRLIGLRLFSAATYAEHL